MCRVRTGSLAMFALAAALAASASAWADLGASYRAGDVAGLRRAGAADHGGLAAALVSPDAATVLGAIVAAEAAPDPWELLVPLAAVAGGWDRRTAAPAARAAARIARAVDGDRAILDDVPDDRLEAAAIAWQALASRPDRWSDVRVHALEAATRLARARAATADPAPDDTAGLLAATLDPDPQLRRAALELMPVPPPASALQPLAARVASDDDPAVRLAAAQALCAGLPADADAVIAALGAPGLEALRTVLAGEAAARPESAAAVLDAARCLAADDDPQSRRTLARLRHAAPRTVRTAVGRLAAGANQ